MPAAIVIPLDVGRKSARRHESLAFSCGSAHLMRIKSFLQFEMHLLRDELLFGPEFNSDWHMQPCERVALLYLLHRLRPSLSLEIGTFRGGSLKPIAAYSNKVITFDVDPNQHRIAPLFPRVRFVTGDTSITLPSVIDELNDDIANSLEFVLVDGSHTTAGVCADTNNCLRYIPRTNPCFILFHDSSNPEVREGILSSEWSSAEHLHVLDLDFVPGQLYSRDDVKNQVWGGLAIAILLPEKRESSVSPLRGYDYSLDAFKCYASQSHSSVS